MTQTTVERIATLINEGIDGDSGGALVGHLAVAEIIAAEIDRLQRELAEARAYISTIIDAPKDYPAEEGM